MLNPNGFHDSTSGSDLQVIVDENDRSVGGTLGTSEPMYFVVLSVASRTAGGVVW